MRSITPGPVEEVGDSDGSEDDGERDEDEEDTIRSGDDGDSDHLVATDDAGAEKDEEDGKEGKVEEAVDEDEDSGLLQYVKKSR